MKTLVNLNITMADFQAALREIEPSTTREVYVEVSETTWDDIGGLEDIKRNLTEGVEWPLRFPDVYANAKVEPPRGVLLSGPPGSGKTLIARALANQWRGQFHLHQRARTALEMGRRVRKGCAVRSSGMPNRQHHVLSSLMNWMPSHHVAVT